MSKKSNLFFKFLVTAIFFVISIKSVDAAGGCVDRQTIETAASKATASCKYEKSFFTLDASGLYRIYDVTSNNGIVRYLENGGFAWLTSYYSPMFWGTNDYYYCTDPDVASRDLSNKQEIKSVAQLGTTFPSSNLMPNTEYTTNRESFTQSEYKAWMESNGGNFCPPFVVASHYSTGFWNYGDATYVEMATSWEDALSLYNKNIENYKMYGLTISNDVSDFKNPRVYSLAKDKYYFMEILPLVMIDEKAVKDESEKINNFTSSEVNTEDSQMKELYDKLKAYETSVQVDCDNMDEVKISDGKIMVDYVAAAVKLINAENKGFGKTYTAGYSYPGYKNLSEYMNITLKKAITDNGNGVLASPTGQICIIKTEAEAAAKQAEIDAAKAEVAANPEDEAAKAKLAQLEAELSVIDAALAKYNLQFDTISESKPITCDDLGDVIFEIFTIIMIIAPIMVIIFGTIDFAKATLASDESAIKKAGINFGKRALAAIILFLLPTIVNIILGIATDVGILNEQPDVCVQDE